MKTILLVEDEDTLRGLIKELLEIKGFRVLAAREGVEAMSVIDANPGRVDLVLSDVVMPHMSGTELVERLREEIPDLKVIFMSGYTGVNNESINKSLAKPGVAFLQKPFRLNALVGQVEELLAGTKP